jgi:hypothetical protein
VIKVLPEHDCTIELDDTFLRSNKQKQTTQEAPQAQHAEESDLTESNEDVLRGNTQHILEQEIVSVLKSRKPGKTC